jgi:hypothetical protein
VALATIAHAQPEPETPAPAPAVTHDLATHRFTVMWAPLRLIIPVGEVTAELRVHDKVGVSLTLGGGQRNVAANGMEVKGTEIEGGAQVRYYLVGNFSHGMEVGAELLDEYVTFQEPLPANVVAVAAGGVTVGPFVGYKIATHSGFTFEGQLGARYLAVDPPVTGSSTVMPMVQQRWLPLLHLNVGWSF